MSLPNTDDMADDIGRQPRLYHPSFVDRVTDFIQRQPFPYGLTYSILFVLQSAIFHVFAWLDGWLPAYKFAPILLLFPLWLWGPLAMVTYLDTLSREVLSVFSPLLDMTSQEKRRLEYEFSTMPARSVVLSGVIWTAIYLGFWRLAYDTTLTAYGYGPVATLSAVLEGSISFFVGSVIYYHSLRQLGLVNRTVQLVDRFDLFRLDPVYAFSVLTSRTGVCWVLLLTATLLITPVEVAPVPTLSMLIVQVALALAAFLLPLRTVNRRLVWEKRRQLADLDQRVKATLTRLHHSIDDNSLNEVSQLNSALTGLNTEREILTKIPTWPWRPGLFSSFLSIVVLPIVIFLLQWALGTWLGR